MVLLCVLIFGKCIRDLARIRKGARGSMGRSLHGATEAIGLRLTYWVRQNSRPPQNSRGYTLTPNTGEPLRICWVRQNDNTSEAALFLQKPAYAVRAFLIGQTIEAGA